MAAALVKFPLAPARPIIARTAAAVTARAPSTARPVTRPVALLPQTIIQVQRQVYADAISYSGRWEAVRDRSDGRAGGMSERSFSPGAKATLSFTGRGVTIFGIRGSKGGSAIIAIDGVVRSSHVSFRASSKRTHVPVFAMDNLSDSQHIVAITVLPQNPAGYVNVESAEIRK